MQMLHRLLAAASVLALACGPQGNAPGTAGPGKTPSKDPGTSRSAQTRDSSIASLDGGDALQVYYQFVDDRGRVRFVSTLEQVPDAWKNKVGFVEMSSPPPGSPADAQRLRDRRTANVTVPRAAASRAAGVARGGKIEVILYAADWCGACRMAKRYMDGKGIAYDERNVDEPRWAEEMRTKAGPGGIPVIDIEGKIMRGFSADRLDQMISEASS